MADHFINAGAFTANTARFFNLKDSAVVGPAAYWDVRKVKLTNPTSARFKIRVGGSLHPFPINANGYGELDLPGRLEELEIVSDATVADDRVTIGFTGTPLPIWEAR